MVLLLSVEAVFGSITALLPEVLFEICLAGDVAASRVGVFRIR
jgi:hypothetical protein